ncbi:MAG: polyprenyl diphosphate synthase [Candidatus Undinarchaeales archaeon]|jgi:tritrans,polycis-undecaprenyl-diphosphate synthase [geranylgeranyl-diphosphate specific]|nr:polyprenyl diphosphate synthase [Candidatus Undinarchaeales archaeon]
MTNYPNHLAIIPDGCRRWAKAQGLKPWDGHKKGIEVIEEIMPWFVETYPTKYITGYGLSIENFNRSKLQLDALARLYAHHFKRIAEDERTHKNEVRVQVLGRVDLLPKKIQEAANSAMEATKQYDKHVFSIALAYSGRLEIVDAVKKLNEAGSEISEENISKNLYKPDIPEPDMLLRSSGEQRISNFLLWQGAYTELFFLDKYWPDLTKEDITKAMDDFDARQRRYGK